MNEKWRDVVGYSGLYQISDHGRLRAPKKLTSDGKTRNEKLLKQGTVNKYGHQAFPLVKNGVRKTKYIHHLVLNAFVGPRPEGLVCCHRDCDATNNHVSNLRWDSHKENVKDSVLAGRWRDISGFNNMNCKFIAEDIERIREMYLCGGMVKNIANVFGVDRHTITSICKGRTYV